MNTKIIFKYNSPVRSILTNETTGQEVYRIETPRLFLRSVTSVFRYDPATPSVPNPNSRPSRDIDEPRESNSSQERSFLSGANPDGFDQEDGNEGEGGGRDGSGSRVDGAGEESSLEEVSPLVKNEIARWYWKWFSSARLVFEGKITTRAKYLPFKGKTRANYVFSHKGVTYRWTLPLDNLRCPRLLIDSNGTWVAEYHPNFLRRGKKPYLEVSPAGMAMLDHIVVTFIPVEVERRRAGG